MVATLAGSGALLFGLALLLLPLLVTELSRPGDSAWGALVLVLALVLVTSSERLTGAPMLAVICGSLLVGRLTAEVGRGRWQQLSPEERGRLATWERWRSSLGQARAALLGLAAAATQQGAAWVARWRERRPAKASGKRWVRPETDSGSPPVPEVREVSDFTEIDALLQAAPVKEAPLEGAPAAVVPEEAASAEAVLAPAVPAAAVPEKGVPNKAAPEKEAATEAVLAEGAPERRSLEEGGLAEGAPEGSSLEEGAPEERSFEAGGPEEDARDEGAGGGAG